MEKTIQLQLTIEQIQAMTEILEFTRRTAKFFAKRELEVGGGGVKPATRMESLSSDAQFLLDVVIKNAQIGEPIDNNVH